MKLWTAYLAQKPNDGPAHFERAGAVHHLGRADEALADLRRACALGVAEACALAKRVGG